MSTDRTFEYLLNAMEHAAQQTNPIEHGYAQKRKAVLEYVAKLEARIPEMERRHEWLAIRLRAWRLGAKIKAKLRSPEGTPPTGATTR